MIIDNVMGMVQSVFMQDAGGGSGAGGGTGSGAGNGAGTGSGGSAGSGTGGGTQQSGQGGQGQQNGGGASNTAPTVYDMTNPDALIRVPGSDKPVKFGDHVRGFQSQFTKASQELARIKKEHAQAQQELGRFRQAGNPNGQQGGGEGAAMLAEIEAAPFIDGKTMGSVLRDLQGGIRERDQVTLALATRMQQLEQVLSELHGARLGQAHEGKLKNWLKGVGLDGDQDAFELADIIYRGYEGENLDEEFPAIFEQRWKQMQGAVNRRAQAERQKRRSLPWVPGKGGNAGPGKPQGLSGKETPRELADIFFDRYNGQADT